MLKSKISQRRSEMPLDLGSGLEIKLGDAAKLLPKISRTTLYRWHKYGLDNETAKQLFILHASKRVIPNIPVWRGYHFDSENRLVTPLNEPLSARQIEQLRWFISAWYQNAEVIKNINKNIGDIRDSATCDADHLRLKYERLAAIYRKRTKSLSGRLAVSKILIGAFEKTFSKGVGAAIKSKPTSQPKLTLVRAPSS